MTIAPRRAEQNRLRLLLAAAASAALALVAALFAAPAALAHDSLTGSSPADGESVATADSITLTYSAEPLDLSARVVVKDSVGTVLFDGAPTIDGTSVTADFSEAPAAGPVTVDWRVVSSDGHPIEGTTTFTVTEGGAAASDGGGEESAPAASASPSSQPADASSSAPAASEADEETDGDDGGTGKSLIAAAVVVAAALIVGIVVLVTRKDKNPDRGSAAGDDQRPGSQA
ncbi:copper resistance protein CopC [Helcobacillus massiliensis]|uniref:copper resistance CopC family protein n=1 Tax=Helcobacillus massiliensis TaxID=521392 RepID=UPI0021A6E6C3|nr:copper resistance CopC family protein [Helcobacillus massiliensis]MCT1558401.1 copper resistance protein CopC [Helcobacillus massiliensis]MCT2036827.1 copper resistance protein CopC [Helcobacillus massiliensis]MCT2332608.1 copper resistance protein CopC [Helcobacillus massiliensis]